MQGIEGLPPQPEPGAVREVLVHQLPPHRHRQPEGSLLLPRHLLDAETGLAAGEDRAAEQQKQGDLPCVERVEVLGRRQLEVVGADHRQIDLAAPLEARHHQRGVGPQQGLEGLAPARSLAEQLEQALLFGPRVVALARLDLDLAAQRNRVDPLAGLLADPQPEHQGGHRRVRLGAGPQHGEAESDHPPLTASLRGGSLRAAIPAKKASMACHASSPPWNPRQ